MVKLIRIMSYEFPDELSAVKFCDEGDHKVPLNGATKFGHTTVSSTTLIPDLNTFEYTTRLESEVRQAVSDKLYSDAEVVICASKAGVYVIKNKLSPIR